MKRRSVAALLLACMLLSACGNAAPQEAPELKFSDAVSIEAITALNGQTVTITGYMATLSPISGEYIYLMNLPYQSCPFCVPNTQELANTMAVYAKNGEVFEYTDRPIRVTGKIELGDYTDDFGYEYNYRIVDASYEAVDLSSVSQEYAMYQSLAEDGVIAEINAMFDYLMFICQWTEYIGGYMEEDGTEVTYFLYPGDVELILQDESAYGYAKEASEEYFPSLVRRVQAVGGDALGDLVEIVNAAAAVEDYARSELESENYTYDAAQDKYILQNDADLYERFYEVYSAFSLWLAQYEL